jgi:hypothetical protein
MFSQGAARLDGAFGDFCKRRDGTVDKGAFEDYRSRLDRVGVGEENIFFPLRILTLELARGFIYSFRDTPSHSESHK